MTAPSMTMGTQFSSLVTNIALVAPASTVVGDLLVAIIGCRESGTVTTPSGWADQDNTYNSTAVQHLVVSTRTAQAGDAGSTFTWTNTAGKESSGQIVRISGQHAANPINVFSAGNQGSGTNITNVGATTTAADCLLIHGVVYQVGTTTMTPDAALNEDSDFGGGSATSSHLWVAHETQATPGAIASRSNTASGNVASRKFILAVAPSVTPDVAVPSNRRYRHVLVR